jgi:HEAT repeat protein
MLARFQAVPPEILNASSGRFQRQGRFAQAYAAAVLLKFLPDDATARSYLEESLASADKTMRTCAAHAVGLAGSGAVQFVPLLRTRLADKSAVVRVAAVDALLKIDPQAKSDDAIVTVLLDSLQCPVEPYIVRP